VEGESIMLTTASNDEFLAGWLGTFNSTMSIQSRRNNIKRILASLGNREATMLAHEDFMKAFGAINKNRELTIQTKQQYWRQFRSFIEYVQEATGSFLNFPKKFAKWGNNNKESPESTEYVLTKEQVNALLEKAKYIDFKKYMMLLLQAHTGMRCTQLVTIRVDFMRVEDRWTQTVPKGNGPKNIYAFSPEVQRELTRYLKARNAPANPWLFTGNINGHASQRIHEDFIKEIRGNQPITSHTFRRTINTLRKVMECPVEERSILLNQKTGSVNGDRYTKITPAYRVELYDKWNPWD
jgi:integrase